MHPSSPPPTTSRSVALRAAAQASGAMAKALLPLLPLLLLLLGRGAVGAHSGAGQARGTQSSLRVEKGGARGSVPGGQG